MSRIDFALWLAICALLFFGGWALTNLPPWVGSR